VEVRCVLEAQTSHSDVSLCLLFTRTHVLGVCVFGVCLDAEKAEESGEEKKEWEFCTKRSEWNFNLTGIVLVIF